MFGARIADELEAILSKLVAEDLFSGAVLIALNGVSIFKKAYLTSCTRSCSQLHFPRE